MRPNSLQQAKGGQQAQPPKTQDRMVALSRALDIIAAQVYGDGKYSMPMVKAELFDALASTFSALAPLFVVESPTSVRRLSDEELDRALFRKGGSEMYFADGRMPITNLAVTAQGIVKVLRILKGAALPD